MRYKSSLAVCLAFAFSAVPRASATVINTYSSLTSWEAETDTNPADGFTTIPFSTGFFGSSLTLSGATFTTNSSDPFDVLDETGSQFFDYGTGFVLQIPSNNLQPVLTITLPSAITSFGLNLTTISPYGDPNLAVTVNGTSYDVPSFSPTSGGFAFFGATFTAPVTSFQVSATAGDYLEIDNLSFGLENDTSGGGGSGGGGGTSPTPEAATLLMIGSGLLGMRWASKRVHLLGA